MNESDVRDAVRKLLAYAADDPAYPLKQVDKLVWGEMYQVGDEDSPFFTEAFLYSLLGKVRARTLLSRIRGVCEAVGLDYYDEIVRIDRVMSKERAKRRR